MDRHRLDTESLDEILLLLSKQYFPVVLFIKLNKVVINIKPADEILICDRSMKTICTR